MRNRPTRIITRMYRRGNELVRDRLPWLEAEPEQSLLESDASAFSPEYC